MGSNASKSTNPSAYSVRNYSTILRSGTAFKIGDLDVSERQLLLELRRIILIDEVLDFIVDRSLPKPIKIPRASHDRMSVEDLWSTIWGKVVIKIREEILFNGGIEKDTKYQRRFRNRFRVPFSMFETMVLECKDANIFGRTQIGVKFKLLGCLRILGRGAHCDDVAEVLDCGKTTVNEMFKTFVKNYSAAYYDVHVYVPEGEEMDQVIADYTKMGFPGCVGSMDVTHLMWKQ
jgi:hypothetical protein